MVPTYQNTMEHIPAVNFTHKNVPARPNRKRDGRPPGTEGGEIYKLAHPNFENEFHIF